MCVCVCDFLSFGVFWIIVYDSRQIFKDFG